MKKIGYGILALAGMMTFAHTADAQVIISGHATQNMSCSGGVCTPTAAKAYMNVYSLLGMLANGNTTVEGNAVAPDIVSNIGFSLPSVSFTLTLEAQGNLTINHAITDPGPSGTPVSLIYGANGQGGMLSFGKKGRLTFVSMSTPLYINGQTYALVPDIATLARFVHDNPSGDFALAANYNAKRDGSYSQSPIATPFAGNFEGLGNTISHLVVEDQNGSSQGDGFFYSTGATASVVNLRLIYCQIDGVGIVGCLVADNQGTLVGDNISGTVNVNVDSNFECYAGGLAGLNDGSVNMSSAAVDLSGSSNCGGFSGALGGLVGVNGFSNAFSTIVNSSASGNVNGSDTVVVAGGLVGYNEAQIGNTSASGAVVGVYIGGLAGSSSGTSASIFNSAATGSASSPFYEAAVGGLVGYNFQASVDSSVAKGAASSTNSIASVGGAFGITTEGPVSNTVSYGAVSGGDQVGGFIGTDGSPDSGYFSNDSWDITTSGNSCAAGNSCTDNGITGFH